MALKGLMEKKPLSKISVTELITACDVNRKTFYYHFEDIYSLLKWTLEQETVEIVKQFDLLLNTEEAIRYVIDYVEANRYMVACAYNSMGRDEMKRFFYKDFYGVVKGAIDNGIQSIGLFVDDEFIAFLADFYTEALTSKLIELFQGDSQLDREKVIHYLLMILRVTIPAAITASAKGVSDFSTFPQRRTFSKYSLRHSICNVHCCIPKQGT